MRDFVREGYSGDQLLTQLLQVIISDERIEDTKKAALLEKLAVSHGGGCRSAVKDFQDEHSSFALNSNLICQVSPSFQVVEHRMKDGASELISLQDLAATIVSAH